MARLLTGQGVLWLLCAAIMLLLVYRTGKNVGNGALPPRGLGDMASNVVNPAPAAAHATDEVRIREMMDIEIELRLQLQRALSAEKQIQKELDRSQYELNLVRAAGPIPVPAPSPAQVLHRPPNQPLAMSGWDPLTPMVYMLTPTYKRYTQKADLVRMGNTLRQVKNIHWIVIEDAEGETELVTKFLTSCGVPHTHVVQRTPKYMQREICSKVDPGHGCPKWKLGKEAELWTRPRGVEQRNAGMRASLPVHSFNLQNALLAHAPASGALRLTLHTHLGA
jgi:hypothetical protein